MGKFVLNHMTTRKDWEDFLINELKIKRVNPRDINISTEEGVDDITKKKYQTKIEQAMWDKFVAASYIQYVDRVLNEDPKTAMPHLYDFVNTGLMNMLSLEEETPKIIIPDTGTVQKVNKKQFKLH